MCFVFNVCHITLYSGALLCCFLTGWHSFFYLFDFTFSLDFLFPFVFLSAINPCLFALAISFSIMRIVSGFKLCKMCVCVCVCGFGDGSVNMCVYIHVK